MNALINSQEEEIRRYAANYELARKTKFPIRFARFTGQEKLDERQRVEAEPPHILLTNYMMLELLLTRSGAGQQKIRQAIYENLQFLVFDELHTYRGRQGADVGMLIRRIRARTKHPITCIGTSATMISGGTIPEQKSAIAKVAEELLGNPFSPEAVIQETLSRRLSSAPSTVDLTAAVAEPVDSSSGKAALAAHPTPAWIESRVALVEKEGQPVRRKPQTIAQIVELLAQETGHQPDTCAKHLREVLIWISRVNASLPEDVRRYAYLPFKLHQFFSQTGAVYVSLDPGANRYITLEPGYHIPDDPERPLFPAVFSRYSGETFLSAAMQSASRPPCSSSAAAT